MADDTSFQDGLALDIDPTTIARLPLIAGDHFEDNTANDVLLSAFMLNTTLPRDIFEIAL